MAKERLNEKITVYLTEEEKEIIEEFAEVNKRSLSQQIRYITNKYIKNNYEEEIYEKR